MIRCGLAKNLNGIWEKTQLTPKLQKIIEDYPEHFSGEMVDKLEGPDIEDIDTADE